MVKFDDDVLEQLSRRRGNYYTVYPYDKLKQRGDAEIVKEKATKKEFHTCRVAANKYCKRRTDGIDIRAKLDSNGTLWLIRFDNPVGTKES